jgi:hypothetical protein
LKKEDFKVVEKGNVLATSLISEIKADGESVKLLLASGLSEDKTYQVVYTGGKEASNTDFNYKKATPTAVKIVTGKVAVHQGNVQLESQVLAGNDDVTKDFTVTFTSDNANVLSSGVVNTDALTAGQSFLVKAKVTSGNTTVESELKIVTAETKMAKDFSFFTIGDGDISSDAEKALTADKAITAVTKGTSGSYVVPYVNDQFGKVLAGSTATTFNFKSLNPDILLVNEDTGVILGAYQNGTAQVEITAPGTSFKQIVNVTVQAAPTASAFSLSDAAYETVNTAGAKTVTVTVLDQYNKPLSGVTPTVSLTTGDDEVAVGNVTTSDAEGKATFTIDPVATKSGQAVVKVKVGTLDEKTVTVNVKAAGSAVNYAVTNTGTDKNFDKGATPSDALAFSVFGVDASGNPTSKTAVSDVVYTIKDSQAATVETVTGSSYDVKTDGSNLVVGNYTVTATKNGFTYGTVSFSVSDTTPQLAKVSFATTALELTNTSTILAALNNAGVTLTDQFGKAYDNDGAGPVNNVLEASDIKSVNISSTDNFDLADRTSETTKVTGATNLKTTGNTIATVVFNVVDKDGKASEQVVSFQVSTKIDTEAELTEALASDAATVKLAGNVAVAADFITIADTVTLDGAGYSIDKGIIVAADNVVIDNVKVTASKFYTDDANGEWYYGVMFQDTTGGVVKNSTITGVNGKDATGISDTTGAAGTTFTVENTTFSNLWNGVLVDSANTVATVKNNTISDAKHAIYVTAASAAAQTITGNTIRDLKLLSGGAKGDGISVKNGTTTAVVDPLKSGNKFTNVDDAQKVVVLP